MPGNSRILYLIQIILRGDIGEICVLKTVLWGCVGLLGASSVFMDAGLSHGLGQQLTPDQLSSLKTAVYYQQINSIVIAIGLILASAKRSYLSLFPSLCFLLGTLGFSGGIYGKHLLALNTGMITPAGGMVTALGWILLALLGISYKLNSNHSTFR